MERSSNWKVLGLALVVAGAIGCGTSTIPSNGGTSEKAKEESASPTGTAELSERSDTVEEATAAETPEKKEESKPNAKADSAKTEEPAKKDSGSAEPPRSAQRGNPPGDRQGGPPQSGSVRGGGSGFGGGLAFLLGSDAVRKELNLSDDQMKKIQAALPQRPAQGQGGSGLSREEMQAQFAEAQKKIEAVLTPTQKTRVRELQVQAMGLRAFTNEGLVKELGLSEDQVEKIRGLLPQRRQGGEGGPGAGQNVTPEERQKQREEAMKKALEVLKPDQRARWEKLIGKPFKFPAPSRGTTGRPGASPPGSGGADRDA